MTEQEWILRKHWVKEEWFNVGTRKGWVHPSNLTQEVDGYCVSRMTDDGICLTEQTWAMWQGLDSLDNMLEII